MTYPSKILQLKLWYRNLKQDEINEKNQKKIIQ